MPLIYRIKLTSSNYPLTPLYKVYYDGNVNNIPTVSNTGQPANNLSYSQLIGEGIQVVVPDGTSSISLTHVDCGTTVSVSTSTHFWVMLITSNITTENLVTDCGGLISLVGTRQTADFTAYYYNNPQATIPKTLTSFDITLKEKQVGSYAYEYTYPMNVSGTTTLVADDFEISYNAIEDYCSEGMAYPPGYYDRRLSIVPSSEYTVIDENLGMVQGFTEQSKTNNSITVSWSSVPAGCNKVKIYGNNNVVIAEVLLTGTNPNGPRTYTITGLTSGTTYNLAIAGVTSNNYHTKATNTITITTV